MVCDLKCLPAQNGKCTTDYGLVPPLNRYLVASVVLGDQGIGAFLSKEKRDNPFYKVRVP